ncbi:MAG: hypothetical protein NC177_17850 [Ruminococcus flavefaciens]|nr:hypothetical protein [Ruminococcus flavefaciens]
MIKRFSALTLILFLLVGCASVPDEVKQDMSKYNDPSLANDEFDFSYIEISELQSNTEAALKESYGQFTISDKINFVQPDEINIMKFETKGGFNKDENSKEIMKYFFDKSFIDSIIDSPSTSTDNGYFFNEKDKVYFAAFDNGFIAMLNPESFDIGYSESEPLVKIYHPDRKDDLSDEYQLKYGKCSVSDAVEYINNWFETNYKPLAPYYDYQVNTVIVREHEGNYFYQLLIEALYNDVPLDSYTMEAEYSDEGLPIGMAYMPYGVAIQMVNVNSIDSFTTGSGIPIPEEKEKINECISLESALQFCANTFTEFRDITISDIDIMYTLNPVYETDDEGNEFMTGYNSRPVWEFVIDVPPEDFLPDGEVNTYGDMRKYIYIDMVTGEFRYNFDIVKQGLGG